MAEDCGVPERRRPAVFLARFFGDLQGRYRRVPPPHVDVALVAPKRSGTSVRRNFLAGSGINASFAVHQDYTGRAWERTVALGIAIGAGYLFPTTFEKEVFSDLTGERGILMGALAGVMEAQYNELRKHGHSPSEAFNETVEELTQSLIRLVGENGMDWMYANCSTTAQRGALDWKNRFRDAVCRSSSSFYESVANGTEARIVLEANSRPDYREQAGKRTGRNAELGNVAGRRSGSGAAGRKTGRSESGATMSNYVKIFDTTLRDGEQSPGATMTSVEKLEVACALARLGVDIIEAGFPAASPDDLEAVRRIAIEVGNPPAGNPNARVPVIAGPARANKNDIDKAWQAVRELAHPRIHTFLATSEIHMQYKLKMTRDEVVQRVREMVAYARSLCADVEFSPEDAGRSDPQFLYYVLGEAIKAERHHSQHPRYGGLHHPR